MTVTVLKTYFKKGLPKLILYRDYKKYSRINFRADLEAALPLHELNKVTNDEFVKCFMEIMDKHIPLKTKYVRTNQGPFITKIIRKEIMKRSQFRTKLFKSNSTNIDRIAYKKQRNLCTKLIRNAKKVFYSKLSPSSISDNKTFWKVMKPLFSDKVLSDENITLVDNNVITQKASNISDIFNDFFGNAVKNLNILGNSDLYIDDENEKDIILRALKKYEHHPSIVKIKEMMNDYQESFSFHYVVYENVFSELMKLKISTACPKHSIPVAMIRDNLDIFTNKLLYDFNISVDECYFPSNLKKADITPVHKKGTKLDKTNYRPVSILPAISKIFERLLFKQINNYMENKLSKNQCGFRKNFSAQHCMVVLLEKWRAAMDKKNHAGMILTDLSKAFDCLTHDLMIAKLSAYGFDYPSVKLIHDYLSNRFQRVRINSNYSSWTEILSGVPQGSIMGPLLFNIYLSDLFLFTPDSDIANYADDNTPYTSDRDIDLVISKLENDSKILLQWFSSNSLKANPEKFKLLLSSNDENLSIHIDGNTIQNSKNNELLGVTIDNKLKFNSHVTDLCMKASQKLHALARVSHYMNFEKKRTIMNAFITSQFGYCPLTWMFHSRKLNCRINRIHERALRIVYDDENKTFEELLRMDNSFKIHIRNIQSLSIELFKIVNGCSPEIMNDIFPLKDLTKYCTKFPFKTKNVNTEKYGIDTLSFLGPKIWSLIPQSIKDASSVKEFKNKIRNWQPEKFPCRLCKTFIAGVGFLE